MRRSRDGIRRLADRRVARRDRHGRPATCAGRSLARGVSVRASASTLLVLRSELAASRQRNDRPPRTERGVLRARRHRRDLRVLRPRHAGAPAAVGAGSPLPPLAPPPPPPPPRLPPLPA